MIFYTVNNLLLLLWAGIFCSRKPSKLKNLFFIIIAFTQLFAILLFRDKIGLDYNMYSVGFINMSADGFQILTYKDWEIGFVVLTKLLGLVLPDYLWYMGVFALLAAVAAAIYIYANSEMPWLSTILYVNLFLFFLSMNFIRQLVAISLLMLAWHFIKRKKFVPFLIIILFASLFHQTVLVMIPVYFLIKLKPNVKELILYGYILLWFYMCSNNFIDLITSIYHEEYASSKFITTGESLIYSVFPLVITIISFFLSKTETINLTIENKYLINLSFIGSITMLTMSKHSIIERLSYYFLIFTILLVPVIYRSLRSNGIRFQRGEKVVELTAEKQKKRLAVCFLIGVLLLSYVHFYYGLAEGAHGAEIYSTWLRIPGIPYTFN